MWSPNKPTEAATPKTDDEEVKELKAMLRPRPRPARKDWDATPLRNPPAALRGVVPVTREPWEEVAKMDAMWQIQKEEKGPAWKGGRNGLVEEAQYRRQARQASKPWNAAVVRHAPHVLRGQKTARAEPWSEFHNDDISELNAIEGVSITELYNATADRGTPKKPSIVQPNWNRKGPWSH